MLARLRTAAVFGVEARQVDVEVDVSFGMPRFTMVGLPDASVRESRDRVRSAIRNSGFAFPAHRITVNLAPADVRKAGAAFDLPIALGILTAEGVVERRDAGGLLLLGELSLDGSIHPARGVLPIAAAARRAGIGALLLPMANAREAAIVTGLDVYPVTSLAEAVRALNDPSIGPSRPSPLPPLSPDVADLADIRGQLLARRALEVACAGGHNLIAVGPPGSGKTMMARRVPGILPPMTFDEAVEVTSVHSVAGLLPPGSGLVAHRPFRAPHHTISDMALVGGGSQPRPGEVSLAHNGVLFLDEMLEFNRRVLEVLRQPLEERSVTVARAARTAVFPAHFMLVGAMNPCECGYLGDPTHECRCTPLQVQRYRGRLSGPLRDRIDLVVEVPAVPVATLSAPANGECSAAVRGRVVAARARQMARACLNAALSDASLRVHCQLDGDGIRLLDNAAKRLVLTARAYHRVLRVSRTIADLAGEDHVRADHVAEALQFRSV